MNIRIGKRANPYAGSAGKGLSKLVKAPSGQTAPNARISGRDRVELSYHDVLTAEEEGYIEIDGRRIAVSDGMRSAIRSAYDAMAANNRAAALREQMEEDAKNAERQRELASKEAKVMRQAMEISRRISKGGRVPPQDEDFLLRHSPEMYLAAKMAALAAKKHEKFDSVLEDEEESADDGSGEEGEASVRSHVEVGLTGGDAPEIASVSIVAPAAP